MIMTKVKTNLFRFNKNEIRWHIDRCNNEMRRQSRDMKFQTMQLCWFGGKFEFDGRLDYTVSISGVTRPTEAILFI
jgi:hypothetical protein